MKFNKRGITLYYFIIFITMLFIAMDSDNFKIYLITKLIAAILLIIDFALAGFMPEEILEREDK